MRPSRDSLPTVRGRAAAAAVGLLLGLIEVAAAQTRWTPEQNVGIAVLQGAQVGSLVPLTVAGLLPGPFGTPAEVASLALDIGLKNTPPTFVPPASFSVLPNGTMTGTTNPFLCVFRFGTVIETDGVDDHPGGLETSFGSIFFIPYDPVDNVWSSLGRPQVYHPHASGRVTVDNPYLGPGGYGPRGQAALHALAQLPELPPGVHHFGWEAATEINLVLDVGLPAALIPAFVYSEHLLAARLSAKTATKAGKQAAKELADHVFYAIGLAAEAGLIAVDVSSPAEKQQWYEDSTITTAVNAATQTITVWDTSRPYIRAASGAAVPIVEQNIELEATDFGGVRFGRAAKDLRSRFVAVDNCGNGFEITTDTPPAELLEVGGVPNVVTWKARELGGGPYQPDFVLGANQTRDGDTIVTSFKQNITVVDTQAPILVPPAGFARYSSTPVVLTGAFPLGRPLVVDLADPEPAVTNDAPSTLEVGRRYLVNWQATDASGNATAPAAADPEQYTQIVTIKAPGTNTPPTAAPKSAATLTSAPVEIELTGADADVLDGRADPLEFRIERYPPNGQFEAPLYPYFIDDFRLSPVGDRDDAQTLTRTSPLGHLAAGFAAETPSTHGTFLTNEICDAEPGSLEHTEFGNVIPVDFVYRPTYVHVSDDGFYYMRDAFFVCGETPKSNQYPGSVLKPIPRLSKWTDTGELVAMQPLYPTDSPLYGDTNLRAQDWPTDDFSVDHEGRLWLDFQAIFTTFGQVISIYSYDAALGDMRFHGTKSYDEQEAIEERITAVVGDSLLDLLYEVHVNEIVVRRGTGAVDLTQADGTLGSLDISGIAGFFGTDAKVDSRGNLYVLDRPGNRVHKFTPTIRNDAGEWELGEYVGWLGSCTVNLPDPNGVPYNGCDEALGVSRGYACTDATCGRAASPAGAAPGQFDDPRSIEIDPKDVLYVADMANARVQRFGPDGTFAGEAHSTGTGVNDGDEPGFILGNMGEPRQLSVNSSSFYVMELDADTGDNFVHVFKTLPFYDVTDASAKVKYVSMFDFQGTDTFTYTTTDGIDSSAPAAVDVAVTRAFRPPERLRSECFADETLAAEIACTLPEDGTIVIRLSAYDADGFVSTGGLDTLTLDLLEQPARGALTLLGTEDNSARYRYTPEANFHGSDGLTFDAFDGVERSLEQKRVTLSIEPRPDPVAIALPEGLRAGRGFRRAFTATYDDVDADDASDPQAKSIAWGDGVTAAPQSWANSGRTDSNGREVSPQSEIDGASGVLVASHVYGASGHYTLAVTMSNAAEGLPDTVATANVEVIEATQVGARLVAPEDAVAPDTDFALTLEVTNHLPAGWAGLTAGDTEIAIAVPDGLTILALDGRCARDGAVVTCALGDLAPGQAATLGFSARVALAAARERSDYPLTFEIVDDGPNVLVKNLGMAAIGVADRDDDGVIDFDDAFPDDARYSADTDGDGLADVWEREHGFDPAAADDVDADVDGDGFTLAEEFANGSYPLLAEREVAAPGATLTAGAAGDDRFGQALAGGDFNRDGFADTVIGAPRAGGAGGPGAVFIAYGGADGASSSLVRIDAPAGVTLFGRSLAVGDLDGNGYPDLAVGGANAVSIHMNNGEILATPDGVLTGTTPSTSLGVALAAGDLDGDGAADLVATTKPSGVNGAVLVYLSARGGVGAAPLVFSSPLHDLGDSAAIADIDGDGAADLLVGAAFSDPGFVYGFRAAHNNWPAIDTLTASFVLPTPIDLRPFGYTLATGADIFGDGVADLVVGAYEEDAGRIYVYDSADAYWNAAFVGDFATTPPAQTVFGLDNGGQPGDGFGDQFGVRVALGHLDTDTYADVVVGANRAGVRDAGQVQILRGSPSGLAPDGQVENGAADFGMLGYFVAIPGDVNGDGFADIAAGAPAIATAQNPSPAGGYVETYHHAFVAVNPSEDADDDGVPAALDNCPADANTDRSDVDGDGAGDVCDDDADGDGFLNEIDNCPLLASSVQTNSDADMLGDLCDDDDDNDTVDDVDDAWPLDPRYGRDSDGDGLPDEYEAAHGFDANDASDAAADLDGDGRSNLEEFLAGTDVAADDVAPALTAPADIVVTAIGAYTTVALGTATATDAKDGALTALPDDPGPFRPGRHLVEWRATDAAGNAASDTQQVDVVPLVDFVGASQVAAEGGTTSVTVKLNGEPVSYPVAVPYTIGGTAQAGSDYFVSGTLDIVDGDRASLDLQLAADAASEGEETIVVTIGAPTNAAAGSTAEHVVRIVETNVAPRVVLRAVQSSTPRSTFVAGDGPVRLTAGIEDPNVGDGHAIDWSGTDPALLPSEGLDAATFTFDPASLGDGVYVVAVRVTDDGNPAASASAARLIRIVAVAPAFEPGVDTDGDGTADVDEGLADVNENGVSDYLEPTKDANVLVSQTGRRAVLQARTGLRLALGRAAAASGADASVTPAEVASYGSDGEAALNADDDRFVYPTGLYDFELHGLAAAGESAEVAIPLGAALPARASYRKYRADLGWRDFVIDERNTVASAPGSPDACPAAGSSDYRPGLAAGHYCIQLTIEDGGPNDADGVANRALRDPGGAAVAATAPVLTVLPLTTPNRTVAGGSSNVVVLRFRLNSDSPDVVLDSITLAASGTGNDSTAVRAVKLWLDAGGDGTVGAADTQIGAGVYSADNGSLDIALATPHALATGDTDFLVTYDF